MNKVYSIFIISIFIIYSLNSSTKNNYAIVSAKSGLVLRSQPTVKSKKIITIPFNAEVNIINKSGPKDNIYGIDSRWYKIKYKNKTGWAFGGFLESKNSNSKKNNLINNEKPLTGRYEISNDKYSPELIINDNNSFSMTLNVCTGMLNVEGKYKYEDDLITAEIRNCKECFGFSGIEGMAIIFKRISNTELIIENEIYRFQDGQKFGFCAPNKGDIFRKKY